jgi:hypothetical protein
MRLVGYYKETIMNCFGILYVPYPCFGIFINSVLSYVKCVFYLICTLIYGAIYAQWEAVLTNSQVLWL